MTHQPDWRRLDKDLTRLTHVERATGLVTRPLFSLGLGLGFIVLAGLMASVFFDGTSQPLMVIAAAVFGAYLALNIGANDVANNMGPAVGAKALPMAAALVAAALAETAGALLGGPEVIETISRRLIDPAALSAREELIPAMLAAMAASALWVNLATWLGAPVSTTQSIIGAILGAAVSTVGVSAVNWPVFGNIATSWMLSPLIGAALAMTLQALIKTQITARADKLDAACVWVPLLLAIMAGAFATYVAIKWPLSYPQTVASAPVAGLLSAAVVLLIARPVVRRKAAALENQKSAVKALFRLPLVLSAILMSFAHGANDVANAVGPLAVIVQAVSLPATPANPLIANSVPLWVLLIGTIGMSMGVLFFGPRLIRMVGSQITKLNPVNAYCVSTAAALTVICASWLGLPVSSTHVAVGAVFGVGYFRELYDLWRYRKGQKAQKARLAPEDRRRRKLVRRSHVLTILAAWLVTVPICALLAAVLNRILHLFA